jgi:vacuolar-type H+-ATPase subunit H
VNTPNSPTGTSAADPLGVDPVLDEARHAVDEVAEEAKSIAREAQAKMTEIADDTTAQAKSFAEENKGKIASQITAFANALNKAAEELEHSDQGAAAGYAKDVARGIENMSVALKERGVDDLMESVQQFARTQPAAFLGMAALAGFAASRFAKATSHRSGRMPTQGMPAGRGADSLAASSPQYPDGDRSQIGQYGQGLGSSGDAAAWRSTGNYPQTERGH